MSKNIPVYISQKVNELSDNKQLSKDSCVQILILHKEISFSIINKL